jgi:pimeloyl-ACP methyl ester carboxylesterase
VYDYERHFSELSCEAEQATVVLLPGLFGGGWIWDAVWKALTVDNDYDAVRFPDSWVRLETNVESALVWRNWTVNFLNAANITRPILCGNSLGGLIVLDVAAAHHDRVCGVVASGAPGVSRSGFLSMDWMAHKPDPGTPHPLAQVLFQDPSRMTPEMVDRAYEEIADVTRFRACFQALHVAQEYDATAILDKITCPVLLLWGEQDRVTPIDEWLPHLNRFRSAQLVRIPECGHSPMVEKPDEFNDALLAFVRAQGERNK